MANPTIVDIPHRLGRDVARQRLQAGVGDLGKHIPGGVADLQSSWPQPDRMIIDVVAMGQRLTATLDVEDQVVRVSFVLPGMLSFLAGTIEAAVRRKGDQLLLEKPPAG